ncbi:MAG TPA: hypothetical protein VMF09_01330 [Solirubrobacteraceae bacterium]|nr:hypothetical protein [Solirubrobacteraceae bacterium]
MAVVLVVSACGGSSSSNSNSKTTGASSNASSRRGAASSAPSSLLARIEAICTRRNNATEAVGSRTNTESGLKRIARGRAAVEQAALVELEKLTVPASMEPGWRQFIADRRSLIRGWLTLGEHGLGDSTGTKAFDLADSAQKSMLKAAEGEGLKQCSQAA